MPIGIGIGLSPLVHKGSVLNYDPLKDDDVLFYSNSRSGLTLPDEIGTNDAQILVPTARFDTNAYIYRNAKITGGQAWDVTIRFKVDSGAGYNPLISCGGYSSSVKGLMMRSNTGSLGVFTANGTTSLTATFAHTIANNTWYTLRLQWDGTEGGLMTVTVNGSALTSTSTKAWSGDSTDDIRIGRYSTIYMTGNISKVVGSLGNLSASIYPTGLSTLCVGSDGEQWFSSATTSQYLDGDSWFLDKGYSVWKHNPSNVLQYVPNKSDGTTSPFVSAGYSVITAVSGSTTTHNLWNSKIRFANTFFDRSNATIWNDTCRAATFYDSGNKKDFDITEINLLTLRSFLNDGYRGKLYPICDGNSIDDKLFLQGILLYTTDKKAANELTYLKYTKDIRRTQKGADYNYILDAQGYNQLYIYNDLGGDAVANYNLFKSLIDAGSSVNLIGNKYEVFAISQPLKPLSGQTINIGCELRIKKGTTVNLTSNVAINDTVINVSSVVGFNVGEWVAISDNLLAVQGGSTQTRRVASCGRITEIGASTITIHEGSKYAVTAASGGKLGHLQSVILIDSTNNVTITGTGIVNGNWTNQYDVEPVNATAEQIRMGCGISAVNVNGIIITGTLLIKNANMHGITIFNDTTAAQNCQILNVTATENHDKNILLKVTDGVIINNVTATNSKFEDGITLYAGNINFDIQNINISGNPRIGLNILNNAVCNGYINNVTTSDAVALWSSSIVAENVNITGNGYIFIQSTYSGGNDLELNDVAFDDVPNNGSLIIIYGAIDGVTFNNLLIDGCTSTAAAIIVNDLSGGGVFPQNIEFIGGGISNHTGTKTAIHASADVVFTNFAGIP